MKKRNENHQPDCDSGCCCESKGARNVNYGITDSSIPGDIARELREHGWFVGSVNEDPEYWQARADEVRGALSLDEIDYDIHLDPALEGSDHSEIVEFYVVESSSPCSEDPNKSYRCITMIYELKDSVPCFTAGDKGKLILKIDNKR